LICSIYSQINIENDRFGDFVSKEITVDMTNSFEFTTENLSLQGWQNIPPADYKDTIQ